MVAINSDLFLFQIEFLSESNERRLYVEGDGVQILSLPYTDTSYAFNIFLPKER